MDGTTSSLRPIDRRRKQARLRHMLLEDKCCVVTGAASRRGLGMATAKLFASEGARVAILDLDAEQAKAAAAEVGNQHIGLACNVTDLQQCRSAIDEVLGAFGRIDVLVNNAGITQPLKLMEIKPENYEAVTDVSCAVRSTCRRRWFRTCASANRARSSVCRRSPPSAAAASSAGRTTAPPRPASSGWRRRWRANSVRTSG